MQTHTRASIFGRLRALMLALALALTPLLAATPAQAASGEGAS